ncbi:hypothetical protein FHU30_005964 [Actinomadura rupiterrae]|nr:hypothetical protein [Actinomadura rupiterrae]
MADGMRECAECDGRGWKLVSLRRLVLVRNSGRGVGPKPERRPCSWCSSAKVERAA